jgi:hypothetical protein
VTWGWRPISQFAAAYMRKSSRNAVDEGATESTPGIRSLLNVIPLVAGRVVYG